MPDSIPILTTNDYPGMRVVRVLGPVYGTSVRSRNIVGNFLGGIRAVFGGKQSGYLKMIAQTRDEALAQLSGYAQPLGANLTLAMRFDSAEFDFGKGCWLTGRLWYLSWNIKSPHAAMLPGRREPKSQNGSRDGF